ncbi:hypothetical protein [Albimonas pacifica]|uniref:Uncharacterized protein n=1 Tax=Albimonas pacifica TaxID=1114924 RepID=A0A1I3HIU9_9RHOB|nr:hypothetical protein [Albimonas pacifica]SFI35664.1 hypothetical protein SAMN05216258_10621 [Albimonas pacifica]
MSRVTVRGSLSRSPVARQMRFAAAVALTRTAQDVKAATQTMLQQKLDQPSRWTLNSVAITPATKANLTSRVFFKEWAGKGVAAGKYLIHMETGGVRRAKRFEAALIRAGILIEGQRVIPADGGSLDAPGRNVGGRYTRLLSALRASSDPYQNASLANIRKGKNGLRKRSAYTAWVQRDDAGQAVAIWERGTFTHDRSDGTSSRIYTARPVLLVVGGARYAPTLDFRGLAARTVRDRWPARMREALDRAISTAR